MAPFLFGLLMLVSKSKNRLRRSDSGFTMIELVVVIVVLGILAAVAVPRFVDIDSFRVRAAYDEVAGAVRYAQKLAVASGCDVQFVVSGSNYTLQQRSTSCTSGAFAPLIGFPFNGGSVTGFSFSSAPGSFTFDAMGRSSSGVVIDVGGNTINVVAETGYVDAP